MVNTNKHSNHKHIVLYLSDGHDNDKDDRSEPVNGVIDEQLAHRGAQRQYDAVRHKTGAVEHDEGKKERKEGERGAEREREGRYIDI